jgi:hypothetical protein
MAFFSFLSKKAIVGTNIAIRVIPLKHKREKFASALTLKPSMSNVASIGAGSGKGCCADMIFWGVSAKL